MNRIDLDRLRQAPVSFERERPAPVVVRDRFELFAELGKGAFSNVFFGTDLYTAQNVAIKMEQRSNKHSLLEWESQVLENLQRHAIDGVPRAIWYGTQDEYNVLIMEKGGANLALCLEWQPSRRMALPIVAALGLRMIDILEQLHRVGYVHRDVKPENFILRSLRHPTFFSAQTRGAPRAHGGPEGSRGAPESAMSLMMGAEFGSLGSRTSMGSPGQRASRETPPFASSSSDILLIDFGLATSFRGPDGQHLLPKRTNRFVGTLAFASLNASQGYRHSRRDDVESVLYCLIYLLRGKLPWQNCDPYGQMDSNEYYQEVLRVKRHTTVRQLCAGLPSQFEVMLDYARGLDFEQEPSYRYLQSICRSLWEGPAAERPARTPKRSGSTAYGP